MISGILWGGLDGRSQGPPPATYPESRILLEQPPDFLEYPCNIVTRGAVMHGYIPRMFRNEIDRGKFGGCPKGGVLSMRTYMLSWIALIVVAAGPLWGGESKQAGLAAPKPPPDGKEFFLFDAKVKGPSTINNISRAGETNGLKAVGNYVSIGGADEYRICYRGQKGKAKTLLKITKDQVQEMQSPDALYEGVKCIISYDHNDYGKIRATLAFSDKTIVVNVLTLEKGVQEYEIKKGYRRSMLPPDWKKLRSIRFDATASRNRHSFEWGLRRVSMLPAKKKPIIRTLRIESVRKVQEIYPLSGTATIDGRLKDSGWKKASHLSDFHRHGSGRELGKNGPFSCHIAYDQENLYIATAADFPKAPLANIETQGGAVWQDEALEVFFSAENDNKKKIQFVTNAKGVMFNMVREYDLTAAAVVNLRNKDLKHRKAMHFQDNTWSTEIAFPLSTLKVNLDRCRFMGFQIAQNYHNQAMPQLRTLSWTKTVKFPNPAMFGMLVFNKKPFGSGTLTIDRITNTPRDDKRAELSIYASSENFKTHSYRIELTLISSDGSLVESKTITTLSPERARHHFIIPGVKNRNGLYALYISVANENQDIRVTAVTFNNTVDMGDRFGRPLLSPEPKKVLWKPGAFLARKHEALTLPRNASKRTRRTAAIFIEKYYGYTGRRLKVRESTQPERESGILFRLSPKSSIGGHTTTLKREGYALHVEPERVTITGFDEPGLFYGGVTFFQLIRHRMKIRQNHPVSCVEIVDWPDLEHRFLTFNHPWHFANRTFAEVRSIDYLIDWVDRFMVDQKMNLFYCDLSAMVRYRRRSEFSGKERIYSLDDLRKLGDFCHDHFVDTCPAWAIGGHSDWWLSMYHPELKEKGQGRQVDVTHPDHDPIVYDCFRDVLEAMRPKYMTPKGDEWWHGQKPGEKMEPTLLNGQTRDMAFLQWHTKLNTWLNKQGIQMLLFEDMLNPYHNGKRHDVYKIIDRFPKNIIMTLWAGGDPDRNINYFLDKGFDVWCAPTSWWTCGESTKTKVNGYGKAMYSFGNNQYLYEKKGSTITHYVYAPCASANYSWNILSDKGDTAKERVESGRLPAIRNMLAVRPNPYASETFVVFDLRKQMNRNLNMWLIAQKPKEYAEKQLAVQLPRGDMEFGNIPMHIPQGDNDCIVISKGDRPQPLSIPAGNYSSLVFLHSAYIDLSYAKTVKAIRWREWIYGYPCGAYLVEYEDGKVVSLPLRDGMNIHWIDGNSFMRSTNENRYVHILKDVHGNDLFLYQWEWINPYPQKKIAKVSIAHDDVFDLSLLLTAISGRKVQQPAQP